QAGAFATTTAVSASPRPSVYGQAVTFTATVAAGGTPVTRGTVTFHEGSTTLASGVALDGGGHARLMIAPLPAPASPPAITAHHSGSGQYAPSSGSATQPVNRAPLTVTADNKAKVYGQANPALTARYSGFVLGQGPADLGGTLSLTTTATAASHVG